jgi:hypothetical protein
VLKYPAETFKSPTRIVAQETSADKTQGPDVLVSDVDAGPTYKVLQMHVRTAWTAAAELCGVQFYLLTRLAMNMDPRKA